jgi:hypothetical protein
MPAELLTKSESAAPPPIAATEPAEDALHKWARRHVRRVRRLKFHIAAYVLGMVVLTPLWALIEWQDNGGFERWSANSNPGDWEPWILYVAIGWGLFVAITAIGVYFDKPTTEAEVERELERLRTPH